MDNLVLIRVAAALSKELEGAVLVRLREDAPERFGLLFERADRRVPVAISLHPADPWIGRPVPSDRRLSRRPPGPFAAGASRAFEGRRVEVVQKAACDRIVRFRFGDGSELVAELMTHRANLVHVDARGLILATARHPKSFAARLARGARYEEPPLPRDRFYPFGASAGEIDEFLRQPEFRGGDGLLEALRRRSFGIGSCGAELVLDEALRTGATPGSVLVARLKGLIGGRLDLVVRGSGAPMELARSGALAPGALELLPWTPEASPPDVPLVREDDAAATAGLYYEAIEASRRIEARHRALGAILDGEIRRTWEALRRVKSDLATFAEPERHRRFGEALLAGLSAARRVGDEAFVPDPWHSERGSIAVPAPAGKRLQDVAAEHFERARRAQRGLESARARRTVLEGRLARLERLAVRAEAARGEEAAEKIEVAMRAERIPVALGPGTRAAREAARSERPRLAGVRLATSRGGDAILVGKTGKDNDRLTFRIAAPEDIWLHASGVAGAHVVLRASGLGARPSAQALEDAAAIAAWYSEARRDGWVDVVWTRRKNVRRARGATPGTVTLKRFETLRVRPSPPAETGEESEG